MNDDDVALTDGHWAPDHGGIQRWVRDPAEVVFLAGSQLELNLEVAS